MDEPVNDAPVPSTGVQTSPPLFDETLPGCILGLACAGELTGLPFAIGVLGCGYAGYWVGAESFPGTGAEYVLASLGGLFGIFIGFALVGAAVGALIGWGIRWCLWTATEGLFGVKSDPLFWWPIYAGAGFGGLFGFVIAVAAAINTVRWWRHLRARRKGAGPGTSPGADLSGKQVRSPVGSALANPPTDPPPSFLPALPEEDIPILLEEPPDGSKPGWA